MKKRLLAMMLVFVMLCPLLAFPASAAVNFNALDYMAQNGGQFDFRRWSQDQLPWGAEVLGADTATYRYGGFSAAGCLITALAKIAVQSGQYTVSDMNPSVANQKALAFTNRDGAINDWSKAASAFGFIMERNIAFDSIVGRLQQNPNLQFILGVNETGGSGISHYVPVNNPLTLQNGAVCYDDSWGSGSTQYATKAECDANYRTLTFKSAITDADWRYEQYGRLLVGQAWPSNSSSGRYYCKIVYMFTPVGRPAGDIDADTKAFDASAYVLNATVSPLGGLTEASFFERPSLSAAVKGKLKAGESIAVSHAGTNSQGQLFYRIGEGTYKGCYLFQAHAHPHAYTIDGWDVSHPHKLYRACSCGAFLYIGGEKTLSGCQVCYPVTGIRLSRTSACMKAGGIIGLFTTILPEEAPNRSVVWTVTDPTALLVYDGVVNAFKAGIAAVRATTVDGGFSADCTVCVLSDAPDYNGDGEIDVLDALLLRQASLFDGDSYPEKNVTSFFDSLTEEKN